MSRPEIDADGVFASVISHYRSLAYKATMLESLDEAAEYRELADQLVKLAERYAEREDALLRLREIGALIGCHHVDDPDGRRNLINCFQSVLR